MNIEQWIEDHQQYAGVKFDFVVRIDLLQELLKTHALVPRDVNRSIIKAMSDECKDEPSIKYIDVDFC